MEQNIEEKKVTYTSNGTSYDAYLVHDKNEQGKKPGVLVVPEWWGLNDYTRSRAKKLAELGYAALAIDVYGNGEVGEDPDKAGKLAGTYYEKPELSKEIIDAALEKFKTFPQVDPNRMLMIGYCFGGFVALNAAKLGADVRGVVSFHGGLTGVAPKQGALKAKFLICHGANDTLENDHVATFRKQMDDAGADYRFVEYPGAQHAFTNPVSTEVGKKYGMPIGYDQEADEKSWEEMKTFFNTVL